MSREDLTSTLWRERALLELLLFRLEVEKLVLSSGRPQWLSMAAREVESVLEEMRHVELLRAVSVDALADELHLQPNPSLREIAESSREPWRAIWLDHREAFASLTARICETSRGNRVLAAAGYRAGGTDDRLTLVPTMPDRVEGAL